jgi:KUP system potassium uptake protein
MYVVMVTTTEEAYEQHVESTTVINDRVTAVEFHVGYMEQVALPTLLTQFVMSPEEEAQATYYLSDRKFKNMDTGEITGITESVFAFMHRNSATPSKYFGLPDERIVTLATQVDL